MIRRPATGTDDRRRVRPDVMLCAMKLAPIIDPNARKPGPKPAQVDLHRVFFIGTLLWLIATVISLVAIMTGDNDMVNGLVISVAGMIIGVLMLIWEHFYRWYYRRLGNQQL